jgi:hypothetical protein
MHRAHDSKASGYLYKVENNPKYSMDMPKTSSGYAVHTDRVIQDDKFRVMALGECRSREMMIGHHIEGAGGVE